MRQPKGNTKMEVKRAINEFRDQWCRHSWMRDHGTLNEDGEVLEGTIDPDSYEDRADEPIYSEAWNDWDCRRGVQAYRIGDALVMRWWCDAYGQGIFKKRKDRDLWVEVDAEYFLDDDDD